MLQTMRDNAQGLVAKIIVGFIIFVFAIWGVESIVTLGGGEKPVATVGDYEIFKTDVQRKVDEQKSELRRQFGNNYDENLFNEKFLEQSALEQLINEKVAQTQAEELGLYASSKVIDQIIRTTPSFQSEGKFDPEQFRLVLRMNNLSVVQYRSLLANSIKQNQVRAAFMLSTIETPFAVQFEEALNNEQRSYSYAAVNSADLESSVNLSEEEIESAYQANIDRYRTPEKARIKYVLLDRQGLIAKQEVTEEDLEIAYADYRDAQAEREQRAASHILFEIGESRTEEQAMALAATAKARIDAGESFAAVAADVSEDVGSAADGGSLGINGRGAFDPAFDDALFALQEKEVSGPVVTEYGVHLIRADQIILPEVPAMDEVRDELTAAVKQEKAGFIYAERIQDLENLAYSSTSIDDVAEASGLTVQESDFFTFEEGQGVTDDAEVRSEAFQDNMKLDREVSKVIETEMGAVVFAVSEFEDARARPLEEVRTVVVARLTKDKALEAANDKAKAILAGEAADWKTASGTLRQATDAPRAVHQKAFALTEGGSEVVKTTTGYAVVKVDAVDRKSWENMAVTDAGTDQVRNQNARDDMISYQAWSKANTAIEQ